MKTESASPAEPVPASALASPRNVLVWDVPVRVFHWLMVLTFAGAYLTAESERWRLAHVTLGYTMGGLVAFRLVWGLIGSRHARFASFVKGPAAVVRYVRSMWGPRPEHHVGHNPAGALAIVLLLAMAVAVTASGCSCITQCPAPGTRWQPRISARPRRCMRSKSPGFWCTPQSAAPPMKQAGTRMGWPAKSCISRPARPEVVQR